jgi:hypothetical protein
VFKAEQQVLDMVYTAQKKAENARGNKTKPTPVTAQELYDAKYALCQLCYENKDLIKCKKKCTTCPIHDYSDNVKCEPPGDPEKIAKSKIVPATFISIWTGSPSCISSECLVNLKTREVFKIRRCQAMLHGNTDGIGECHSEYVVFADGVGHEVYPKDEVESGDKVYWYFEE